MEVTDNSPIDSRDGNKGGGRGAALEGESYEQWVVRQAELIHSDKCTWVSDWKVWCCYQHDLACYYKKNPEWAYRVGWELAPELNRKRANEIFWRCDREGQQLWGKLRADVRFVGVELWRIIKRIK